MALKLSTQDKKDMDKFTRFLALKAAQIIVQSRTGAKVTTPSKSQTDWFNIAIPEVEDVLAQAKEILNGEVSITRLPLCVEISLRTVEGDQMVLESWCLGMLPEQCDLSLKVHTVYNRLGILLKSLVSVTRVIPAYKLARRQTSDAYVICYRIFKEEPLLHTLGEGYKQMRIGQICTPVGTIQLTVFYRTKMTISPTQPGKDNSIMLKSDHFNTNLSPKHLRYKQNEENNASLSDTMKIGAFADCNKRNTEPELILPNIPFSKLLVEKKPTDMDNTEIVVDSEITKTEALENEKNGNSPPEDSSGGISMVSADDFIMVDLKTPFASKNSNSELGMFYREWQTAPPLKTFTDIPPLSEQVHDLSKQLESYESDMKKYEDVLQSFIQSPNNN